MTRYAVISADGHAGPPAEVYRDYLDPGFRERFDEHQRAMEELRAAMGRSDAVRVPTRVGRGDRRRRRPHRRLRLGRAQRGARRRRCRRRGAVPGRGRARHRTHRVVAVRDRARRRVRQRRRGGRGEPRPQPVARRLRARGAASPHRDRGDPGDHPRHGHGAARWCAKRRSSGTAASSSRRAGSTVPRTTTRGTSRCGRSPRSSASCCTRIRARGRATSVSARACCRSTRPKPAGGRRARSRC